MSGMMQEATRFEALLSAAHRAAVGKRYQPQVARFMMDLERECLRLQGTLRLPLWEPGSWRPGVVRTFILRDPKLRRISIMPFEDRVVHHALCAALEPSFERYAIHDSYACRRGKGSMAAVRRAQQFCRRAGWVLKVDIQAHFASIPHDLLLDLVWDRVRDRELCARIGQILGAGVKTPGVGLPIGALTSQHLANLYLGILDHWIKDELGFRLYLRFMDDALIFGERAALVALLPRLEAFAIERLRLKLNKRVTQLRPVRDGVPFLGVRVYPGVIRLSGSRWRRTRRRIAWLERRHSAGFLGETELAIRVSSIFGQMSIAHSRRVRVEYVRRRYGASGGGQNGLQPREPGRLLERPPAEAARGEPRQGRAVQAQRQPGLSSCELSRLNSSEWSEFWADEHGSWTGLQSPGVDQADVLRPLKEQPSRAKSQLPGGGLRRGAEVVAGLFFDDSAHAEFTAKLSPKSPVPAPAPELPLRAARCGGSELEALTSVERAVPGVKFGGVK